MPIERFTTKLENVALSPYFEVMISSEELGMPKKNSLLAKVTTNTSI
jgi:FMN phosphatase YigB (HAD superfamily)